MSTRMRRQLAAAIRACSVGVTVAIVGCAATPPGPLESPAPRHPDYLDARPSASTAETAYTRQLKQRIEAPPREPIKDDGSGATVRRPPPTPLASVSEMIAELYSADPPNP